MQILREMEKDAIPVEAKSGTILYFNNALLHSSKQNLSEHPRRAYVVHYMKASIRPAERGKGQRVKLLAQGLGIPEGYVSEARLEGCVFSPDDEQSLNWDTALGRNMVEEDLRLPDAVLPGQP
jgi:ectoine hydroxylase-related dioxygenase (phytanoyl-CoA dioxygenase family)